MAPVSLLSSMATRGLLTELAAAWDGQVGLNAAGGVEAARRVRGGEAVDILVLAAPVMQALEAEKIILTGSLVGIAVSTIAAAVREGDPSPDLSDEACLRRSILGAGSIGYSTGPSGDHLLRLLDGWGIRSALGNRLVQAPPGVPVGRLLAERQIDLAFQQRSELMEIPGLALFYPLPPEIRSDTVFTAGIVRSSPRPSAARGLIEFFASDQFSDAKRRFGMETT